MYAQRIAMIIVYFLQRDIYISVNADFMVRPWDHLLVDLTLL